MPNTLSAKKRLRQNETRRLRNRSVKSVIRSNIRKLREAVAAGDDSVETLFRETAKRLDRAAASNVIHKNKASRTKSRLQSLMKKAKQQ